MAANVTSATAQRRNSRANSSKHGAQVRTQTWLLGLAILLATLGAYVPAARAGTIWDDDQYLTQNPHLADLDGLQHIWIPGNTPQYYPAVFTAFWVEQHLWGLNPIGYHVVNIVLHALNALLLWRLCRVLRIPGEWFVAAIFALHPVHVESVAWITERKNVMSAFFYLLAALAFLRFDDARQKQEAATASGRLAPEKHVASRQRSALAEPNSSIPASRTWPSHCATPALFVLALLSKTVTCSLPAALVLAMIWQRKRITAPRIVALLPLFAIGLALGLHTAYLERTHVGATGPDFDHDAAERLLIASKGLLFYSQKLLWPWPLSFIYPRWDLAAASIWSYWPVAVVLSVVVAAVVAFMRGFRGPPLALAFFAGTLIPALGFFDVYPMRYSFVADHFQYLASIGIIALVVGAISTAVSNRTLAVGIGLFVLLGCASLTSHQTRIYADEEALWRATIRTSPSAWIAHSNLAKVQSERGQHEAALEGLRRALTLTKSTKAANQIRFSIASVLGKLGRYGDALQEYDLLQASSGDMEVRIAQTLDRLGRDYEAEAQYRVALTTDVREQALAPFGVHLLRRGRPEEAIEWLAAYAAANPGDMDALMFLADAYAAANRIDDAIRTAESALASARAQKVSSAATLIERRIAQLRSNAMQPSR